jgi:hypothetical protein
MEVALKSGNCLLFGHPHPIFNLVRVERECVPKRIDGKSMPMIGISCPS